MHRCDFACCINITYCLKTIYTCIYYLTVLITCCRTVVELKVVVLILVVPGLNKSGVVHILEKCNKKVLPHSGKGRGLVCTLRITCKGAHFRVVLSHHCQLIIPLLYIQNFIFCSYSITLRLSTELVMYNCIGLHLCMCNSYIN